MTDQATPKQPVSPDTVVPPHNAALRTPQRVSQIKPGEMPVVPKTWGEKTSANAVLITRRGNDLLATTPDGEIEQISDFYTVCANGQCAVRVQVADSPVSEVITTETPASQWLAAGQEQMVFRAGSDAAFVPLFASDPVVAAAFQPAPVFAPLDNVWSEAGAVATTTLVVSNAISPVDAVVVRVVKGTVAAGPVLAGNQLTITVYDSNGHVLGQQSNVPPGGNYEVTVGSYRGAITVVVSDGGDGPDYRDEAASGAPKDLDGVLVAVAVVTDSTTTVNINPLTTLAAQRAGLDVTALAAGSVNTIATPNTERIVQANTQVAQAMGLGNTDEALISAPVQMVINLDGTLNPAVNDYGRVLAAISGAEKQTGKNTQALIETINTGFDGSGHSLNEQTTTLLIHGGQAASVNVAPIFGYTIDNATSDNVITANEVQVLTDTEIGTLTPTQIRMFDGAALAALSPTQLATDSGSSSSDNITNVGTVNVTGLISGTAWGYSIDNGGTWTVGRGRWNIIVNGGPQTAARLDEQKGN